MRMLTAKAEEARMGTTVKMNKKKARNPCKSKTSIKEGKHFILFFRLHPFFFPFFLLLLLRVQVATKNYK